MARMEPIMKQAIGLFLVIMLLVACAAVTILAAGAFFVIRTAPSDAAPSVEVFAPPPLEHAVTPTPAALPPVGAAEDPDAPGVIGNPGDPGLGGFNGSFSGTLAADNGSSAPATLTLSQTGSAVSGRLSIGDGLSIDAGNCGVVAVPAGDQNASGTVDAANPNRLATASSIPVSGLTIGVALAAELAADGNSVAARVDLDLPFLCGRDAAISGTFVK